MVFNTLTFAAFFAIVLAIHSLPLGWTTRKVNLLLASYVFYAAWSSSPSSSGRAGRSPTRFASASP